MVTMHLLFSLRFTGCFYIRRRVVTMCTFFRSVFASVKTGKKRIKKNGCIVTTQLRFYGLRKRITDTLLRIHYGYIPCLITDTYRVTDTYRITDTYRCLIHKLRYQKRLFKCSNLKHFLNIWNISWKFETFFDWFLKSL